MQKPGSTSTRDTISESGEAGIGLSTAIGPSANQGLRESLSGNTDFITPETLVTRPLFNPVAKPPDILVMPDVKDLQLFQISQGQENSISDIFFTTEPGVAEIIGFCEKEMTAKGWEIKTTQPVLVAIKVMEQ